MSSDEGRIEWPCGCMTVWYITWFGEETADHHCNSKRCKRGV